MIYKITKTILLTIIALFSLSSSAGAQFTRLGGGLGFSTEIATAEHKTGNPGINARGVIELGDKIWLIPSVTFYMPGKMQSSTTLFGTMDVDFAYKLATEKTILFYALAGADISYLRSKFDSGETPSKLTPGLNIGTGIEMIIEKDLNGFVQIKGVVNTYQLYIAINIGVHYYISNRRYKSW